MQELEQGTQIVEFVLFVLLGLQKYDEVNGLFPG